MSAKAVLGECVPATLRVREHLPSSESRGLSEVLAASGCAEPQIERMPFDVPERNVFPPIVGYQPVQAIGLQGQVRPLKSRSPSRSQTSSNTRVAAAIQREKYVAGGTGWTQRRPGLYRGLNEMRVSRAGDRLPEG